MKHAVTLGFLAAIWIIFPALAGERWEMIYGGQQDDIEKAQSELSTALNDPNKRRLMECIGVKVWAHPPAGWTAPTQKECYQLERMMGIPENELQYMPLAR
jgi:hypothetical protein